MKKIFDTILQFYSYKLPNVLVWLALALLGFRSFEEFFTDGNFTTLLPFYFSAIGITIALASVTFTYSNTKTRAKAGNTYLISAGELFLYAALVLITVLLISWLGFEINNFIKRFGWYSYAQYIITFIFAGSQAFLVFAANSLSKGLEILDYHLWFKVREKIK